MNPFVVGQEYGRREDIHRKYGGGWQGGISPSARHPMVFLFTGPSGSQYGYHDSWHDGVFWYTGEGQSGDMKLVGGNLAITQAEAEGRTLLLFEQASRGRVTFLGEARHIRHHEEPGRDRAGNLRRVIVFELAVETEGEAGEAPDLRDEPLGRTRPSQKISLAELRRRALAVVPPRASAEAKLKNVHARSRAVRLYVLRRADGVCENCGSPAPFQARSGELYLEPHHVRRRADDGPDHPRWVAAICPNCHREIHSGMVGDDINRRLGEKLRAIETE